MPTCMASWNVLMLEEEKQFEWVTSQILTSDKGRALVPYHSFITITIK
jgi:hypothetical protein